MTRAPRRAIRRLAGWATGLVGPAVTRERERLRRLPRRAPARSPLLRLMSAGLPGPLPPDVDVPDAASFLSMADEIFGRRMYAFPARRPAPRIIDVGANVGASVLYFRAAYPAARIVAFEADPALFQYLRRNVGAPPATAGSTDLVNMAAWDSPTTLTFTSEGADSGRAAGLGDALVGRPIRVPACRLRDFLDEPTDMLKVDIEGAELRVLRDCADRLSSVEHLFVEYHSFAGEPQRLHELLALLADAGFRVAVEAPSRDAQPLVARSAYHGMDLQANVFAYRGAR